MYRHADRLQSTFVLTLLAALLIPLAALDALTGSSVSLVTRYAFPSWVALEIAVAYLLAAKTQLAIRQPWRGVWTAGLCTLLALGVVSCVVVVRSARTGAGRVIRDDNWQEPGFVAADNLSPQKARILLQLALGKTSKPDEIQLIFDEY